VTGPVASLLPDGKRLHLNHGPIDLIIGAEGECGAAFRAARIRFETVLDELVAELPQLRSERDIPAQGAIARAMQAAVRPLRAGTFITPMAAVAGAVADEILAAMTSSAKLTRSYVNNGGDIAFHLAPGRRFRMAMAEETGGDLGRIEVSAEDRVRGIATSGRGGRSLSFGIADSVTVLARTAAMADAAATLIANAVDLPGHPGIARRPASDIAPESDLGARPVTVGVGPLTPCEIAEALDRGAALAQDFQARGVIHAGALFLRGQARVLGVALTTEGNRRALHA
jgi:ApbE superfamily uncharacterized protein (UPF0280 family)